MKVEFCRNEDIITLIPDNKYPNRKRHFQISFHDDCVVFTIQELNVGTNIQITYDEWYQMMKMFFCLKTMQKVDNHD